MGAVSRAVSTRLTHPRPRVNRGEAVEQSAARRPARPTIPHPPATHARRSCNRWRRPRRHRVEPEWEAVGGALVRSANLFARGHEPCPDRGAVGDALGPRGYRTRPRVTTAQVGGPSVLRWSTRLARPRPRDRCGDRSAARRPARPTALACEPRPSVIQAVAQGRQPHRTRAGTLPCWGTGPRSAGPLFKTRPHHGRRRGCHLHRRARKPSSAKEPLASAGQIIHCIRSARAHGSLMEREGLLDSGRSCHPFGCGRRR